MPYRRVNATKSPSCTQKGLGKVKRSEKGRELRRRTGQPQGEGRAVGPDRDGSFWPAKKVGDNGTGPEIEPELAQSVYEGILQSVYERTLAAAERLRAQGAFGPAVEVSPGATLVERLLGLLAAVRHALCGELTPDAEHCRLASSYGTPALSLGGVFGSAPAPASRAARSFVESSRLAPRCFANSYIHSCSVVITSMIPHRPTLRMTNRRF